MINKLTITIDSFGNDAFDPFYPGQETARILRKLADRIEQEEYPGKLLDSLGNSVGTVEVKEE